jgi:hypothetical protein
MKNLRQGSLFLVLDLKTGPPDCEVGVLTSGLHCLLKRSMNV